MTRGMAFLSALVLTGCSACATAPAIPVCPECPPERARVEPDVTRMATLVGIDGLAHACPVEIVGDKTLMLTARHVAVSRTASLLAEPGPSAYAVRIGDAFGFATPVLHSDILDIGVMVADFASPLAPYRIATERPKVGDSVWLVDFDRRKKQAFQDKGVEATVVTVLPGHILLDDFGQPGASGGCVLNRKEEVVGIYVAYIDLTDLKSGTAGSIVGMAVTVDPSFIPADLEVK